MNDLNQEHISKAINVAFALTGASNQDVADQMGISVQQVRAYRRGQIFDVRQINKLSQILSFSSIDEFLMLDKLRD